MTGTPHWPSSPASAGRPLSGVKVLDLSRVLAGPFATMILADLGADVIKAEPPAGDETRRWGPPFFHGTAAYYYGPNRNKWGVILDLASPDGRERLDALLREADVVVHNFTAGVAERLAVDSARVRSLNPRAIHLTISGFGPEEPDRRGYDLIVQALGGLMAVTGEMGGGPVKVGVPIADLTAGLYASNAIAAALYERSRTGAGCAVHVSLYESVLCLLSNQAAGWLLAGAEGQRLGTEHPHVTPYGVYAAKSASIVIAAATDAQFTQLCTAIGRPGLATDARFASNSERVRHRDELRAELEQALAARPTEDWAEVLDGLGIPNGAVRSVSEALTAPEARSIAVVTHPRLGPVRQVMSPIRVNGDVLAPYLAPPALGEHDGLVFPADE